MKDYKNRVFQENDKNITFFLQLKKILNINNWYDKILLVALRNDIKNNCKMRRDKEGRF